MSAGRASRNKGARGEREFANLVRSFGFTCERTGRDGRTSQDVTHNIADVHLEVKRCESYDLPEWIRQAEGDADAGETPVIAFRKSRQPWRVVVPAVDFLRLKALERDLEETREFLREAA